LSNIFYHFHRSLASRIDSIERMCALQRQGDPFPPTKYGKSCALQFRARQQTWLSSGSSSESSSSGSGATSNNGSGGGLLSSLSSLFWAAPAPAEKDMHGSDFKSGPMLNATIDSAAGAGAGLLTSSTPTSISLLGAAALTSSTAETNQLMMASNEPATGRQVICIRVEVMLV